MKCVRSYLPKELHSDTQPLSYERVVPHRGRSYYGNGYKRHYGATRAVTGHDRHGVEHAKPVVVDVKTVLVQAR